MSPTLKTNLADYPVTMAIKDGRGRSDIIAQWSYFVQRAGWQDFVLKVRNLPLLYQNAEALSVRYSIIIMGGRVPCASRSIAIHAVGRLGRRILPVRGLAAAKKQ
jgi:hypothetical protein